MNNISKCSLVVKIIAKYFASRWQQRHAEYCLIQIWEQYALLGYVKWLISKNKLLGYKISINWVN